MSWLNATEALQVLGVRPQTLYANVSRKKIRAKPDPKDTRRSLYHEADVRRMARQRGANLPSSSRRIALLCWSAVVPPPAGRRPLRGPACAEQAGAQHHQADGEDDPRRQHDEVASGHQPCLMLRC